MKFSNVATGVKKIYTAEILSLIAAVCGFVTLIMTILAATSAQGALDGDVTAGSAAGMLLGSVGLLIFGLGTLVLLIIAFIINIQGVSRASKDETDKFNFKTAFYMIIASIVVSVVSGFFSSNEAVNDALTALSSVFELITTFFVLYGIADFAEKIADKDLAAKAKNVITGIAVAQVLAIITKTVSGLLTVTLGQVVSIILAVISLILSLVYYILYLKLLGQAKNAFAKA